MNYVAYPYRLTFVLSGSQLAEQYYRTYIGNLYSTPTLSHLAANRIYISVLACFPSSHSLQHMQFSLDV